MFNNLMIDIETLSKKHNAAIISVAAIPFNDNFEISKKIFHHNINLQSCIDNNLVIEAETLEWWLQTNAKLLTHMLEYKTIDILNMLINFSEFIDNNMINNFFIWAKGITFDLSKLSYYYEKFNIKIPWSYRNERCLRTKLHGINEYSLKVNVNPNDVNKFFDLKDIILDFHNPIVDCFYQIKLLEKINEQGK